MFVPLAVFSQEPIAFTNLLCVRSHFACPQEELTLFHPVTAEQNKFTQEEHRSMAEKVDKEQSNRVPGARHSFAFPTGG